MAKKSEKNFTFPAPEGFALPDGTQPGEPFQVMAVAQQNDDGSLQLVEFDGLPVGPTPEPAPDDDESDEDDESGDESSDTASSPGAIATPAPKRVPKPMSKIVRAKFMKLTGAKK